MLSLRIEDFVVVRTRGGYLEEIQDLELLEQAVS